MTDKERIKKRIASLTWEVFAPKYICVDRFYGLSYWDFARPENLGYNIPARVIHKN